MSNVLEHQEKVRRMFREEATEHFAEIHRALASATSTNDRTELRTALRAAHSVKGGARIAGLPMLADMIHDWESRAAAVLEGGGDDVATMDELARVLDAAQDELESSCGESETDATVRVPMHKLDRQMANVEDLLRLKVATEKRVTSLKKLFTRMEASKGADDVTADFGVFVTEMSDAAHAMSTLVDSLHADARALRMLPVATVLAPFERMVRELGRSSGKQVVLEIVGGGTEVDRDVLEALKDPVMHLLRNSVDHGIETSFERMSAGKPAQAIVRIVARAVAGMLELEVTDDGRGIVSMRVAESAVARGILSEEEASRLDADAVEALLFEDGFSTAAHVTDVSGRGLGLAVVRDAVEHLGGQITLHSDEGRGTRVTMTLPLNLATSRLLLVEVAGQCFAVPAIAIQRVIRIDTARLSRVDHGFAFDLHGEPISVFPLTDVLGTGTVARENRRHLAVVVGAQSDRAAFTVDRIVDEQELIARGLGDHVEALANIAGATVLADGRVVLILNVAELLRHARSGPEVFFGPGETAPKPQAKRILVVDDSITARTLEKSILEAAGYSVETAVDGTEAIDRLMRHAFDLVVSDVQMPKMDGLGLVRALKQDEKFKAIPIVLVSSLDNPDQRRRGLELGADAYLGKADFEQGAFLHTVDRFSLTRVTSAEHEGKK